MHTQKKDKSPLPVHQAPRLHAPVLLGRGVERDLLDYEPMFRSQKTLFEYTVVCILVPDTWCTWLFEYIYMSSRLMCNSRKYQLGMNIQYPKLCIFRRAVLICIAFLGSSSTIICTNHSAYLVWSKQSTTHERMQIHVCTCMYSNILVKTMARDKE